MATTTPSTAPPASKAANDPGRESYRNAGPYSLWHCCFGYIFGLVKAGGRRPISVTDTMLLRDDMKCQAASVAFDELWAEQCANAAKINESMSAEEIAESSRLEGAFREAQLAERKSEDTVKSAEKKLLLADKTALHYRGNDEEKEKQLAAAAVSAKSELADAETASKAATVSTNEARVLYRASKAQPSAIRPLLSLYWPEILYGSLFLALAGVAPFAGPYAIDYVSEKMLKQERISYEDGVSVVLLVVVGALLNAVGQTQSIRVYAAVGVKIRAVFCASVFKKTLRMTPAAMTRMSKGRITNLMSIDSNEICMTFPELGNIISGLVIIILGTWMIVQQLGSATWAGFGGMVATTPITMWIMMNFDRHNTARLEVADRRIDMLSETLNGIRMVKCFAWEKEQEARAETFRKKELFSIKMLGVNNIGLTVIFATLPTFAALCSFATYTGIQGHDLTPGKAFVSVAVYNIIQIPLMFVPMMITGLITILNSLRRLGEFLSEEELPDRDLLEASTSTTTHAHSDAEIFSAKNASLSWGEQIPTLTNLSFSIKQGKLTAIVGPVGSGKSSLLSAMLGEMVVTEGSISNLTEPVCFAPQTAWIVNDTVRGNIVFGLPFDQDWYQKVIKFCCLEPDLDIMPGADSTEIGERGINLSGGQKARISLARVVYSQRKICLLDDPLAAVDVHVGKTLFDGLFKSDTGLLANTTRVLVTNQLQFLSQVDDIIVVESDTNGQGRVVGQGTFNELMSKGGRIAKLLKEHNTGHKSSEKSVTQKQLDPHEPSAESSQDSKTPDDLIEQEDSDVGAATLGTYKQYMEYGAGMTMTGVLGVVVISDSFAQLSSDIWLAWWSQASTDGPDTNGDGDTFSGQYKTQTASFFLATYAVLFMISGLFNFFKGYTWVGIAVRASRALHLNLLQRIMGAPVSFFDKTPIGRILNRFSADTNEIDSEIMWLLDATVSLTLELVSRLGLVIILLASEAIVVVVAAPVVIFAYYCLFAYYAKTNVGLKQHEAALRSPIFAHFGETIDGVASIRAYGTHQISRFEQVSQDKIDRHHSVYFTEKLAECWFSFVSTLMSGLVMALVTTFIIVKQDDIDPGLAALCMTYAVTVANLMQFVIWMVTMLQQKFISVRRVLDYTNTVEQEAPAIIETSRPPLGWPSKGLVEFDRFQMRYRQGLEPVLTDVSLTIAPGEKIGIVGRTGAGKSSLVSALFRIVERDTGPDSGPIKIDGVDIQTLGLTDLRSNLTMVPQEPVLFSGTIKNNLDPAVPPQNTDAEMIQVLELCGLKSMLAGMPEGLEAKVFEGGSNLSAGERQLVCLARALLRRPKVLVMDEATANVDMETDALIQRTLRTSSLADSTILVIAHRLQTIMDMDKILLLNDGRVAEFGPPHILLQDPQSQFSGMVDAGKNSGQLRQIAADAASGVKKSWWHQGEMVIAATTNGETTVDEGTPTPTTQP